MTKRVERRKCFEMLDFMENRRDDNCLDASAHPRHIYVHIPFCARICPYCAFYKERADPSQTERFCAALVSELEMRSPDRRLQPHTIFFGGGTPTALASNQIDSLLREFHAKLNLSELREWTFEANPGSVSVRKARLLFAAGVNRISLGVQSWDDSLLKLLGREHNSAQAEDSFKLLRDSGFRNLNIDLMFGLPGQTLTQWSHTLGKTIALGPDHISTYCLTYEEDTPFFLRNQRGEFRQDSDADAELYEWTMETLEAAGYPQYETSNYARAGFESIHNAAYWEGADYLGLGPSAFSTIALQRWQNVAEYRVYAKRVLAGASAVTGIEQLTSETKRAESIALSLRTRGGVPVGSLHGKLLETEEFLTLGLMVRKGGSYVLTRAGKLVADSVAAAYV